MKYRCFLISVLTVMTALVASAAEPDGYYTSCENKSGANLLKALNAKVGNHTVVGYDGLWNLYKTSDITPNGKLWDMYSTKEWPTGSQRCGNYKLVGDCVNREHSFPKSWFNDAKPMYSDAFHLYPTDGKVNGQRSNFPYGECANGTTLPSNGSVKALGRLGTSTFPGYTGKVFEPVDEYKGDFARSYFYMAAAYNDKIASWHSDMLAGNSYPAFSGWAVELLLKWHRMDPVSKKELDRNEAVYQAQKNRNPFIDHPELAEHIWGDKKNQAWSLTISAEPQIVTPVNASTVDFGKVAVSIARTSALTIQGQNLAAPVSVSVAGDAFKADRQQVTAAEANREGGVTINLTCMAAEAGYHSGTLTLTCGDLKTTVNLRAEALTGLPAADPTEVSDRSFVAHWTYVGNEDSNGCYTITVLDASGSDVDTYPRSVPAKAEAYLVDELDAETDYTYFISCRGLRSNTIAVTTKAPIPMIQFLYDGDLDIVAVPGEPSEAYELLVDVDNIDTDITVTVAAPFEISTDKTSWATTTSISPVEDRIYIRVNSAVEGVFETNITARAADYMTDDAHVSATVSSTPDFVETFEPKGSQNYNAASYNGAAAQWSLSDAGIYQIAAEAYQAEGYLRMGKSSTSAIVLEQDRPKGVGQVEFYAMGWRSDGAAAIDVQYSTDAGATWSLAGTVNVPAETAGPSSSMYKKYNVAVNKSGAVRIRLLQTKGKRVCIDNLALTPCAASGIDGVTSDYRSWDAYGVGHTLNIQLSKPSRVAIYGIDGVTYADTHFNAGITTLDMPAGLYIVVVEDFSRRVLIR